MMVQEQNLTTGVLTMTLQPGRIGGIRFKGAASGHSTAAHAKRPTSHTRTEALRSENKREDKTKSHRIE